jgi:hypothetical protein
MTVYAIDDEFGTELTAGLAEHECDRVAQALANRLGKTVYLYCLADDADGDAYEAVEPEVLS